MASLVNLDTDRFAAGVAIEWCDSGVFDWPHQRAIAAGNVFHNKGLLRASYAAAREEGLACPVATIRHGDGTTIWPLRLIEQFGFRVATDLSAPIGQYSDVLGAPLPAAAMPQLSDELRRRYGADVLLARRVRTDGGLAATFGPGCRIESDAAPYIDLAAHCDFETYTQRFGKQTRRNRNQRRRRLEEAHGTLSFEVRRGREGLQETALALGWKRHWLEAQELGSQVLDNGVNEATLLEACNDPAVLISVLRAGIDPIAIEIGFTAGQHYAAYLGAFAPEVARFSAGQEQMLRTIEWCFAENFARYDLLAPTNPYKSGWADDSVVVHDHCIGLSVGGNGYAVLRRMAQSPIRRLRDLSPSVRRSARRYGLPAAGLGATAMALSVLAD